MKACNFLYFFSLFFYTSGAIAVEYTDLGELITLSEKYLQKSLYKEISKTDYPNITINSRSLSPRLKLAQCDKPLTFKRRSTANTKGHTSVNISCNGSISWSVYVKHTISLEKDIIVLNSDFPRHHLLRAEDLSYITKDTYKLRSGYINDQSLIVGYKLKRSMRSGSIIYNEMLKTPNLIKKGDSVNVVAKIGSLSVITPGIALKDGRKGEQIDVENRRSSRIIRAEIVGPDTVVVIL